MSKRPQYPVDKIMADLEIGQSTASSMAGRLSMNEDAVTIILTKLQAENKVISFPLGNTKIQVWKKVILSTPTPDPSLLITDNE